MAKKEITLELTAFLDSAQAQALEGPAKAGAQRIVEAFLSICYDELGTRPSKLDGQDVHEVLGHRMPGRFKRKDPLAAHVPLVLEAYLNHLEETQTVSNAFEIRNAFVATIDEFQETVRTGENAHHHHHHVKQDPVVHKAPKLGRNDPCSCGSGKKFKKCHGRDA